MYVYIYMDKTDICVFVFIFINGGVSKRKCPIIYIYTYSHTYIYLCVCFQNLKDWYNFDLGECLKHRTQFSCSIYCKDKGDLEKTGCLLFIYYRYKNSTGSCFFAGRTHGWEALRDHTPKTNAEVIQYIQKSYTLKGLVKIPQVGPIKAWN